MKVSAKSDSSSSNQTCELLLDRTANSKFPQIPEWEEVDEMFVKHSGKSEMDLGKTIGIHYSVIFSRIAGAAVRRSILPNGEARDEEKISTERTTPGEILRLSYRLRSVPFASLHLGCGLVRTTASSRSSLLRKKMSKKSKSSSPLIILREMFRIPLTRQSALLGPFP